MWVNVYGDGMDVCGGGDAGASRLANCVLVPYLFKVHVIVRVEIEGRERRAK